MVEKMKRVWTPYLSKLGIPASHMDVPVSATGGDAQRLQTHGYFASMPALIAILARTANTLTSPRDQTAVLGVLHGLVRHALSDCEFGVQPEVLGYCTTALYEIKVRDDKLSVSEDVLFLVAAVGGL